MEPKDITDFKCPHFNCPRHKKMFTRKRNLRQHLLTVHTLHQYSCTHCSKKFGLRYKCTAHELECGFKFICSECNSQLPSSQALHMHLRRTRHNSISAYEQMIKANWTSKEILIKKLNRQNTQNKNINTKLFNLSSNRLLVVRTRDLCLRSIKVATNRIVANKKLIDISTQTDNTNNNSFFNNNYNHNSIQKNYHKNSRNSRNNNNNNNNNSNSNNNNSNSNNNHNHNNNNNHNNNDENNDENNDNDDSNNLIQLENSYNTFEPNTWPSISDFCNYHKNNINNNINNNNNNNITNNNDNITNNVSFNDNCLQLVQQSTSTIFSDIHTQTSFSANNNNNNNISMDSREYNSEGVQTYIEMLGLPYNTNNNFNPLAMNEDYCSILNKWPFFAPPNPHEIYYDLGTQTYESLLGDELLYFND